MSAPRSRQLPDQPTLLSASSGKQPLRPRGRTTEPVLKAGSSEMRPHGPSNAETEVQGDHAADVAKDGFA